MNHKPVKKIKTTLFVVWTVPLIALFFASFFVYKYYDERGVDIVITFEDGSGFNERKTYLMYKGIKVGKVTDISVHTEDISKIDVTINVEKRASLGIARRGTQFYKVEPKVSLTEISGLKAILSGVYIDVYPAKAEIKQLLQLQKQFSFVASSHKPIDLNNPALFFTLLDKEGKLRKGTPIIYKNFEIGRIIESELLKHGVEHRVMIQSKYADLIKEDSKFFGLKALEVKASLTGIKVELESMASLIAGGIKFTSPKGSPILRDKDAFFELYSDKNDMVCDLENITLIAQGGYNLDVDFNQVLFKGVNAGTIENVTYKPQSDKTYIEVKLKKEFRMLIEKGAYFWIVQPKASLDGVSGLDAIMKGNYIVFEKSNEASIAKNKYILHTEPLGLVGVDIHLSTPLDSAVSKGSKVFYHSIEVGVIKNVELNIEKDTLDIDMTIINKYASLINDTTLFYHLGAIEADISIEGLHVKASPLDSMLRGGISFDTKSMKASLHKKEFKLYDSFKEVQKKRYLEGGGRYITLLAEDASSLSIGSPLLYDGFKAGEVTDISFDDESELLTFKLYVEKKFLKKINSTSRFFNSSALKIKAGLSGIDIELASATSLLSGSISFITPNKKASEKSTFMLYETKEDFSKTHKKFTFYIDNAEALSDSSELKYRGIVIGNVISRSLKENHIEVKALVQNQYEYLFVEDTKVWVEGFELGLGGVKNSSSLISGAFITLKKGDSTQLAKAFSIENKPLHVDATKGLRIVLEATKRSSLKVGSPLFFRQIKIGSIESVSLKDDSSSVEIALFVEECYSYLIRENSIFYNAGAIGVDVNLLGVKISTETVETMISGGIAVVTPDEFGREAKDMMLFKLFNKPDEAWLEYAPSLENNNSNCQ